MKDTEVYEKMDYEGGFWELVNHSGTEFLKGTPFEDKIALIEEAQSLADEISSYFEAIAEDEDEEYEYEDEDDA